jgi:hypothetical protein
MVRWRNNFHESRFAPIAQKLESALLDPVKSLVDQLGFNGVDRKAACGTLQVSERLGLVQQVEIVLVDRVQPRMILKPILAIRVTRRMTPEIVREYGLDNMDRFIERDYSQPVVKCVQRYKVLDELVVAIGNRDVLSLTCHGCT